MSDKLSARENTLVGKTTSDIYVDLDLDGQDDWDRVYEIIDRVFGNIRQAALPDDTLDKAAYIAATICAHGYLQNTEDEGRVAHVIRQSLAALPDDADPQAGDVETIAEGDEEAGEANLRNSYARTKAMHSKNYASVGDADWDAAVLADEIARLRAALPTPCPPGRGSRDSGRRNPC